MKKNLESNHKRILPPPELQFISPDSFRPGLSFFMHILMSYSATVYSFISLGSYLKENLRSQDIWTDGHRG